MKTLLRLTLCGIALLGLQITAHAQKTLPAYIVTAASDTIQGQLLKESESKRTFRIKFDAGSGLETYEAKTIQAYGIGDSLRFEAKDVFVDEMQNRAFLKVIVDGPTKLYYSRNLNNDGQFYIQKPGEPTIQLRKSIYRSILSGILNDCQQMAVEQGSVLERNNAYSAKSLGQYVHRYNNCKYPETASQTLVEEPKVKFSYGILVGGHYATPIIESFLFYYNMKNLKGGPGITTGIQFNIGFDKNFSVQNELLYTSRTIGFVNGNIESTYLQLPVMGRFTLNSKKIQPYFNAGPFVGMSLGSKIKYESGESFEIDELVGKMIFGAVAGAGVQKRIFNKHSLSLEVRYSYEHTNGSFNDQIRYNNFTVLAGISF